jgi:hypothetical protein
MRRRHNCAIDGKTQQRLVYADTAAFSEDGDRRSNFGYEPAANDQGTLRLARRRDVLYALFAEGDSSSYRIVGKRNISTADIQVGGVAVCALTNKQSFAGFRLTDLTVRADRLSGPAVESPDYRTIIAEINEKRVSLKQAGDFDFVKENAAENSIFLWGNVRPWQKTDRGLRIEQSGTTRWSSGGLAPYVQLDGDFDLTAEFQLERIVNADQGRYSSIFVKVHFDDEAKSEAGLVYEISGESLKQIYGRTADQDSFGNKKLKRLGTRPAKDVVSMRLARYGSTMYMLAKTDRDAEEELISMTEVSTRPFREHAMNFMVHTRGEGRVTHAKITHLTMRADKWASRPTASPLRIRTVRTKKDDDEPKSFLDRVINFFD